MRNTTSTVASTLERCYRDEDFEALTEIYADDVILDVHVPQWRFQVQGPAAAITWIAQQVQAMPDFRVTWARATPSEDGGILQWEMRTGRGEDEQLCRQVDVLHRRDGHVVEHVLFCTGLWDAATIARQKAEAPMVRW